MREIHFSSSKDSCFPYVARLNQNEHSLVIIEEPCNYDLSKTLLSSLNGILTEIAQKNNEIDFQKLLIITMSAKYNEKIDDMESKAYVDLVKVGADLKPVGIFYLYHSGEDFYETNKSLWGNTQLPKIDELIRYASKL